MSDRARAGAAVADPGGSSLTRRRVARSILEHGPSTAAELAERLDLTGAAVRRHLDALLVEGHVSARERMAPGRRGRGRPAKEYRLTDAGRDEFEQAYDDLAASALRYVREIGGAAALQEFARLRLARLAGKFEERSPGPDEALAILVDVLNDEGYVTSAEPSPAAGEQLCQHHCPVAHVAAEFPELCEAETEVFSRLLGSPVQRLATIAHGDGVCTTHVSLPTPSPSTNPAERTNG